MKNKFRIYDDNFKTGDETIKIRVWDYFTAQQHHKHVDHSWSCKQMHGVIQAYVTFEG